MAGRRLSMRKIKEVLRLKWQTACSNKKIATSCNISRSTVREYLRRAQDAGLTWPLSPESDDKVLENLLFPVKEAGNCLERQMPSMEYLFRELKRKRETDPNSMASLLSSVAIQKVGVLLPPIHKKQRGLESILRWHLHVPIDSASMQYSKDPDLISIDRYQLR